MNNHYSEAVKIAQQYYDKTDTDTMYTFVWGGEHIHYGIYTQPDESIHNAGQRTVEQMVQTLEGINENSLILDIGAGYGGTARYLAKTFGCSVCCLNLSSVQNKRNRQLNQEQKLESLIEVTEGNFEEIPYPDNHFDIVWSQDAILHSGNRTQIFQEIKRVLKAGGEFIFTDPMQSDDCPPGVLQAAFDRLGINDMGSYRFYRQVAQDLDFEELHVIDLSEHVATHYLRLGEEVRKHYEEAVQKTSQDFVEHTLKSIEPWIDFCEKGYIKWGILHFRNS